MTISAVGRLRPIDVAATCPFPAAALPASVVEPASGATLHVERAWPREPGRVHLELLAPSGALVPGQWFADPQQLQQVARATPGGVLARAEQVLLQPAGADRRLTGLRALLAEPGSRLVVHRPERRAVVRRDGPATRTYAKVVRPGRSAPIVANARRVEALAGAAFDIARVVDHDPATGTVEFGELPGATLHSLGADPCWDDRALVAAWHATGRALAALHAAAGPILLGDHVENRHTVEDECAAALHWVVPAQAHGLLPSVDVSAALAPLWAGVLGRVGLLHRDLHDKQLVVDAAGRLGLLDTDTLAVGERAVDVANLLVHLRLRVAQGALTGSRGRLAADAFLDGLDPDALTLARVPAYERVTQLRLAGVYAFRPRWAHVARSLLATATEQSPPPAVEIVIPARNEERDLARSVHRLHAYLRSTFPVATRVTIADNASTDGTWQVASDLTA